MPFDNRYPEGLRSRSAGTRFRRLRCCCTVTTRVSMSSTEAPLVDLLVIESVGNPVLRLLHELRFLTLDEEARFRGSVANVRENGVGVSLLFALYYRPGSLRCAIFSLLFQPPRLNMQSSGSSYR